MLASAAAMTDLGDELFAAILAAPDDDAPRLVYGDHLLARGDVQGELIQIQCSNSPDSALRRREAQLVANRGRWLGRLTPYAKTFAMRRGFLDELVLEGRRLLTPARLAELLADPRVALLRSLSITESELGVASARAIADALGGTLARLRALSLDRNALGDEGAALLAPAAGRLATLHLTNARIGDAGARSLAEGDGDALRDLDLCFNEIRAVGAAALAASPRLAHLTRLDLTSNPLEAEGAVRFAERLAMPALRDLDLSWCNLGFEGAALGAAPCLADLVKLDLCGNALGNEGFARLLESPHLGHLEELMVGDNELGDTALAALCARADALPALTYLRLENNPITDDGMRRLCESRLASQLERVGVWGGHALSPEGKALYVDTFGKWRATGWPGD
jgi:uncharacterized protein (TIGR02996 family)